MALGRLNAGENLGVLEAGRVMAQVRARIERHAELREGPSLDEPDLGLRDVAARELLQELHRRDRAGDQVVAGLDVALAAHRPGEHLEMQRTHFDPGAVELRHGRTQARARGNFDIRRKLRDLERRRDIPSGVAAGAEQEENYESEKGLQDSRDGKMAFYDAARAPQPLRPALGDGSRCRAIPS